MLDPGLLNEPSIKRKGYSTLVQLYIINTNLSLILVYVHVFIW